VARHLHALDDPDQAASTPGRASNEAAFLYQLFVRAYGTNNFPTAPTCATRQPAAACRHRGGKGTVTLDDFEHADTLLLFGQNPATNHPRMLGELREARAAAPPSSPSTRCASGAWSASPARSTAGNADRRQHQHQLAVHQPRLAATSR
jgi:anaerobic selenocysteine-containing dehydrogenase